MKEGNKFIAYNPVVIFSNCPTTVSPLYPCNIDVSVSGSIPTDWFRIFPLGSNTLVTCGFEGVCDPGPLYAINASDEIIKEGSFLAPNYTEETQWQLERQLYQKLQKNPELQTANGFASFYNNLQVNAIGQLEAQLITEEKAYENYFSVKDQIINLRLENENYSMEWFF